MSTTPRALATALPHTCKTLPDGHGRICAGCREEHLLRELAAWEQRWAKLREVAEQDRDRSIPSFPAEARLQGEVERAAMIAVLKEMAKLEKGAVD